MARKVFISFLGASNYGECIYVVGNPTEFKSRPTRFIQTATLELLHARDWSENDTALILLTKTAEKKNWIDNGHGDGKMGLKQELDNMQLPFSLTPVGQLPDGNTEEEIWQIFERIFEKIEDGDELYFDLTHGFRYLPMLVLVMGNYAKFLKGANVKSISYGNFEGRDREKNEAQIVDMTSLTTIQDWTFAAADFIKNGNADRFKELASSNVTAIAKGEKQGDRDDAKQLNDLASSLQSVTSDFQTCRGINILKGRNISRLIKQLNDLDASAMVPFYSILNPIIGKLKEAFSTFSSSHTDQSRNIENGFEAARWCLDHGLLQQAITILQENIVSYFCYKYQLDISDNKEKRSKVNTAFKFIANGTSIEEKDKIETESRSDSELEKLIHDELITDKTYNAQFSNLSNFRNDINHCGMRKEANKASTIKNRIEKALKTFSILPKV